MLRSFGALVRATALGALLVPAAAQADDPRDPAMRSAAARAHDSALTRQLNEDQLAYVRERDGKIMQDYRTAQGGGRTAYAAARADYARKMAAWRHAVAACNAGRWEYCDN